MKEKIKRICTNWSYCFNFAVKWTGAFFTVWGIIALFTPCDELLDSGLPWCIRLFLAVLIVIGIFIAIYMIGVRIAFKTNQIDLLDVGNNHHVYVQYGDALSPDVLGSNPTTGKRNILVSVNRCFDTIVDDDLISSCSLHGQAMMNLYAAGEYTAETLNSQIQQKLKDQPYISVESHDKPKGNLKRYTEGTVAEIESSSGCVFFFLGLTCFDQMLHPYISDVEYGISLVKALQYCIDRNQGYPIIIPLIGGGRAQARKEEKDILEFLVKLIQMNKLSINCDIHIVVRESAKDSISILGLKK
ncbi:MAG: hypothetical protein HDR28_11730 [Lachnospiraceae bacterium]|nr:hypothetical protein [Lachnospiraceae bacterium]